MVKLLTSYNEQVAKVALKNAPQNAKHTSPAIQEEILHIFANNVRVTICNKIGKAKFCLIMDEARDISKRKQMALVLKFVDKEGFIGEHFLDLVHVKDTTAATFKKEIFDVLSHHNLSFKNFRGQGYDSATTRVAEIAHLIAVNEIDTGRGVNQIGTLQQAGDTRWSSHFNSVCSLVWMFGPTCSVLSNIIDEGTTSSQRGDANFAYDLIMSFEFAFVLYLMKEIMGTTDVLCQALQLKCQDIVNAVHLVSTTKSLIEKLRKHGWEALFGTVKSFCNRYKIEVPDLNAPFTMSKARSRRKKSHVTVEHYHRVDIFIATIDSQLHELIK
uniref:Uncharacterized protein LOC105036570 n=1 Tax=Elaeis guineensis var. tenera TaxID=51953 RepID=A0A6I9QJC4_ELAGV|nr:uncharacterized protein LOC105036570 [Elaeis guineensis]